MHELGCMICRVRVRVYLPSEASCGRDCPLEPKRFSLTIMTILNHRNFNLCRSWAAEPNIFGSYVYFSTFLVRCRAHGLVVYQACVTLFLTSGLLDFRQKVCHENCVMLFIWAVELGGAANSGAAGPHLRPLHPKLISPNQPYSQLYSTLLYSALLDSTRLCY